MLEIVKQNLKILADLGLGEVVLWAPLQGETWEAVGEAGSTLVAPLHPRSHLGTQMHLKEDLTLARAKKKGSWMQANTAIMVAGIPIDHDAAVVRGQNNQVIGLISLERSLLSGYESRWFHPLRKRVGLLASAINTLFFDKALSTSWLCHLLLETKGLVIVEPDGSISSIDSKALSLYRDLGFSLPLIGKHLDERNLPGAVLLEQSNEDPVSYVELQVDQILFAKRAISLSTTSEDLSALWLVADVTSLRKRQNQLMVKTAVIQEIHHRVKNNLQTIASLLRMQMRREESEIVKSALNESVNRIASLSMVHDLLSQEGTEAVNVKELARRILLADIQGLRRPGTEITSEVQGEELLLPADQAVPLALVINELVQNALEHAFVDQAKGHVALSFFTEPAQGVMRPTQLVIEVVDDGAGLPTDFVLPDSANLGLQICASLLGEQLNGKLSLSSDKGTKARVSFLLEKK